MKKQKSKIFICALLVAFIATLTGCNPLTVLNKNEKNKCSGTIFAMDTIMELTIYGDEAQLTQAENLIFSLNDALSVTSENSDIYKINTQKEATIGANAGELIEESLLLCDSTDGALDISIYPVIKAWGFTIGSYEVPSDNALKSLLAYVDYSKIELTKSEKNSYKVTIPEAMEIDLGSVAKGYTGDKLVELLKTSGVKSALLSLGGNIQVLGSKPDGSYWKIAVTNPVNPSEYIGYLEISDKAVITSGGYQRYFEENGNIYHHILDPKTGSPANSGLLSVTIVGEKGVYCDGLSTALFVMGMEKATSYWREHSDFEAIFVDENEYIYITEGLSDIYTPINKTSYQVISR